MKLAIFFLISVLSASSGLKILRNTVDISVTDPLGGAKLISPGPVDTQDLSICMRFNLKVLGTWEYKAQLMQIEDWRTDSRDPAFRLLWFGAWYPQTWFGFGYPQAHGSYASYLIRDPDLDTYKIWNPNKWSHVCLSYQKSQSFIRMVKDGRTLNINFEDSPRLAHVEIPSDFLNKTYLGRCAINVTRGCSSPGAVFTDVNMWNKAMSEQEMIDWTACKDVSQGNILSWEESSWELENMVEEELALDVQRLCKPFRMGYVLFPELRNISSTLDLCHRLKGKIPVIYGRDDMDELITLFKSHFIEENAMDMFWGGWWDVQENGVFKDINTKENLQSDAFQPWFPGEPNGGDIENCVVVWPFRDAWNDFNCNLKVYSFCEFETPPYLQMRGLCFGSIFDAKYSWTGHLMNGHHSFQGYTNTVLYLDKNNSVWRLQSYSRPETYAVLESEEYPLGTFTWTVYNDPCYDTSPIDIVLNFNSCTEEEFNCVDGHCIDIAQRCDGRIDCPDKTDEIFCEMIEIDQSYIKEVPAPPIDDGNLTSVRVDIELLSVLDINEVEGIFAVQFLLKLTWQDERLVLINLKNEEYLNTVTLKDKDKIWVPQVVFFNTEKKEESLQDEKAQVTIERKGHYQLNPATVLNNAHIYSGRENPLTIHRVYNSKFFCEYDMSKYPFDKQSCSIKIILKGNTGNYAQLVKGTLEYMGPIDLTRYYIQSWEMIDEQVTGNRTSLQINVIMGRRILNEILTTYLPTIFICIVSFSTNYFKAFFFEAIVTVNLTSLLVLTTLFISVSDSLPKTSYVKMIDIWLLAVLCIPFLEVILHTIVDALRRDEASFGSQEGKGFSKVMPSGPHRRSAFADHLKKGHDLVSRNEQIEVRARQEYYKALKTEQNNLKIQRVCKMLLRTGLTTGFSFFAVVYFSLGISFANQ